MKIGYDAKRAFMNFTGLGVYSRNVISFIAKSHQVFLYTPKSVIPFIAESESVRLIKMNTLLPKWISGLWRSFYLPRIINSDKLDIYHGLSAELPYGLEPTIKTVVTIHDLLFERYPSDYPLIDRFFAKRKARYACQKADRIVAVSESTRDDIVSFYHIAPEKIEVIPVSVEISTNSNDQVFSNRAYILCVSSFMRRKNQALLIRAFQRVCREKPIDLVLIGGGRDYLKECKNLISPEFKKRIKFRAKVSNEELISYYQHALFSVYPSNYEGFGIPIIESIGYGCPILVSDNKTHLEVGKDYVSYFSKDNQESLELAIMDTIENIERVRSYQMSRKDELLDRYKSEIVNQNIISLYQSLLSS
jgi:glycosyltransferase involved in cell wall biosynthesis